MRQRSSYPKPFKAQVVQECLQPGATVSSVAIRHGINANVIRKWLPVYRDQAVTTLPAFVPVQPLPKRKRPAKSPCALVSPSERIAVSHAERFSCITLSTLINQCETITG